MIRGKTLQGNSSTARRVSSHAGRLSTSRIAIIGEGWFPEQTGGLNRYVRGLHEALDEYTEWEPRTIIVGPTGPARPSVVSSTRSDSPMLERLVRSFACFCRTCSDAQLIDTHFALYGLLPVLLARKRRPLVVHFHGSWADEALSSGATGSLGAYARARLERAVYRRANAHITLSHAFRRVLLERYGVSPWNARVIPPGIDLKRFSPVDPDEAPEHLVSHDVQLTAVCVRRLVPRMGIDVLIRAWANEDLPAERMLQVVGEGPERVKLERLAAELGLLDKICFLGHVSDEALVDAYRAADVAIVPSTALEGFGLVVIEALACGTPVVASNTGGLPEALGDLSASLLVPSGSATALARRLLEPLPSREACRTQAERFSWRSSAREHSKVYTGFLRPHERARRRRVVFLDHTAAMSGGEIALLRQLPALTKRISPHVILAEDGPLSAALQAAGISVEVLPMPETARTLPRWDVEFSIGRAAVAFESAQYVRRLASRLRQVRPDIVQTNSLKSAVYGTIAARLVGIPVVWHIHDRISADYLPAEAISLIHAMERLPRRIICNSSVTRSTLSDSQHATVIPNAVSTEFFDIRPDLCARVPLFGLIGRIARWKGQLEFVRAFDLAFPNGEARGRIIGDAMFGEEDRAYLRRVVDEIRCRGLEQRIELRGFSSDIASDLSELSVAVHASIIPEPFGMVVSEAMAAGLPVIASAGGGPAEMIADGASGLLVTPGDTEALAKAMQTCAHDANLRASLGASARKRVRDYTADVLAERYLTVFEGVMQK